MWPEPSGHDHLAPWNEAEDERSGEIYCDCTGCRKLRRDADKAEREVD